MWCAERNPPVEPGVCGQKKAKVFIYRCFLVVFHGSGDGFFTGFSSGLFMVFVVALIVASSVGLSWF